MPHELDDVLTAAIVALVVVLERFLLWRLWLSTRDLLDEIHRRRARISAGKHERIGRK